MAASHYCSVEVRRYYFREGEVLCSWRRDYIGEGEEVLLDGGESLLLGEGEVLLDGGESLLLGEGEEVLLDGGESLARWVTTAVGDGVG